MKVKDNETRKRSEEEILRNRMLVTKAMSMKKVSKVKVSLFVNVAGRTLHF